ncbi:MAG: iron ABC transporter permease [Eggerthellaceae bacterium]|nr:iron ABC transporter permease [Eggerthellaceae bacterium]
MKPNKAKWAAAIIAVVAVFLLSICVGRFPLSPDQVLQALLQRFFGIDFGITPDAIAIVADNRFPRALAGAVVGASLAASGCAFQGLFQNPLVSQGILGVSSGASFGAALSILIFSTTLFTPAFAFVFALLAVGLSFMVARMCGEVTSLMLVLGGMIISAIFAALLSFLKYVADPYNQLASIVFWNMGSLASLESAVLPYGFAVMIIGLVILLGTSWMLNVLSMGDREASSMGVSVKRARLAIVSGASLATAGAVSIAGTIGWVGLVIPHIARFIVGSDNRTLIPFSMLLGAAFMMLVDILCRTVTGSEIPLGILTSLIGGPFFIYLLRRYKGRGWK